jgi:hypothetical protein
MAQRWENIGREAARTVAFWLLMGLITFFGVNSAIKIEEPGTRLFLVVIAFGVAFGAASVVDHLLWANNEATEGWPRWYSQFNAPIVYRRPDLMAYSYVVLPRPK